MFRLTIEQGVARLALDRPEARNAISVADWDMLAARATEAEAGARLLIIEGSGPAFCAGADLSDFAALRNDEAARGAFRLAMRRGIDRVRTLAIPSIALVEGPCYGAGVALAMACDLRIAAGGARFAITPAKIGISYPQEDIHRLVQLVGPAQAARMLFTGQAIDAAEALRIGLADVLEPDAERIIAAIVESDAESLKVLKRGVGLALQGARHDEEQDRMFDALFASETLAARLAARRRS